MLGWPIHAARGADWLFVQREDHPLSTHDQRARHPARAERREHRDLQGARRATRHAHRDVQPEEAGARDGGIHRHGGAGEVGRAGAGRRRRLQERRRAGSRRPRVSRSRGRASVRFRRSRPGRPGHGRRVDPRGPWRRRASPRTHRKGSEEGPLRGTRERARPGAALQAGARRGQTAADAGTDRRRHQAAARLSVPLGQTAAPGDQPGRGRRARRGRKR